MIAGRRFSVTDRDNSRNGKAHAHAEEAFAQAYAEHASVFQQVSELGPITSAIAAKMLDVLLAGGKVLWCGNGGSAADAQHLAAELVGRFQRERKGSASIALTTDSSVLTSIANDYGFAAIFRRQVEALGRPGDMLVGISTSGNSENVCLALEEARRFGLYTVAMTGGSGGRMAALADSLLCVPSNSTARVQEAHIFCGHVMCDLVESSMHERERISTSEELLTKRGTR
jgi:D-sedoheptulose 7-phosphate isomerase